MTAANDRAHPSPTADPQVVGELDRLQLAEGEFVNALVAAAGVVPAARELAELHVQRASELGRLISTLGGGASASGLRELPHPADQIAGVADPRAVNLALAENAAAQAELYAKSCAYLEGVKHESLGLIRALHDSTEAEVEGYRTAAARHVTPP